MLGDSAKASALSEALLVTINRDSAAIRARDYSAAQRQYVHFRSLHSQLRRALESKGANGARVAQVLRGMGVSGVLSSAQSAAAISAVEAKLSRVRVSAATLGSLAKGALEVREADALASLASPNG
jgi:predicted Fe-Mo cluster-binding NifX family protein